MSGLGALWQLNLTEKSGDLAWLQDRNWPVFDGVVKRRSSLGTELKEPIFQILSGNDSIWKANMVGYLIPKFTDSAQNCYTEELKYLLNNASSSDIKKGLVDYIEIQLTKKLNSNSSKQFSSN